MNLYFGIDDADMLIEKAHTIPCDSPEFKKFIMKLICSFGKPYILTAYGIKKGKKYWNQHKELSRNELMLMIFVMTELSMLRDNVDVDKLAYFFNIMNKKYAPDDDYLQHYAQEYLLHEGIVKENPNFLKLMKSDFINLLYILDQVYK